MKKEKANEKKVVVLTQEAFRKRISFRDYSRERGDFELTVDWIFLPIRYPRYGLLLSDGAEDYRISLNVSVERMDEIMRVFNLKVGQDRKGKILMVKRIAGQTLFVEGDEEAEYRWVSGKGWRLVSEEIKDEDIPF